MTDLAEIAQRILSELEEAGFEDLTTLLVTVTPRAGTADELVDFMTAISELAQLGLVKVADDAGKFAPRDYLSVDKAVVFLSGLYSVLEFRVSDRAWIYSKRGAGASRAYQPEARLTEDGRSVARDILGRRGYQWWKRIVSQGAAQGS